MVGSPTDSQATDQGKQRGSNAGKNRAQMDAHNVRCRQSRLNIKRRREELEKVEIEHLEMVPKYNQMQADCQRMSMELKQMRAAHQRMSMQLKEKDIEILLLKGARHKEAANEERMRLIPSGWEVDGRNFSSFNKWVAWFASQTYEVAPGPGYTNIAASTSGPSFIANQDLPVFGSPYDHLDGPATGNKAGLLTDSASGPSFVANHHFSSVFNAPQNHDYSNLFTHDLGSGNMKEGFPTASAAGSSSLANHDLPDVFDGPNNHDTSDLSTHDPAEDDEAGFPF